MKVEVGQDALGDWAWMVVDYDGRVLMSAEGFGSESTAHEDAEKSLLDLALYAMGQGPKPRRRVRG